MSAQRPMPPGDYQLLKVQTPAVRLRLGQRRIFLGAHNFVAVISPDGRVVRELHGIARGPGGAQLRLMGGVIPFRREVIWGEEFAGQTGFYDPSFPQGVLFTGDERAVSERLAAAARVRAAVNASQIRYPWPAARGLNSNAYFQTLLVAMGLKDIRLVGQLWAPGARRLLCNSPSYPDVIDPSLQRE